MSNQNFNFPTSLKELVIRNNKLHEFPVENPENLTAISFIDLQDNEITRIGLDLLNLVETGLQLHIAGMISECKFKHQICL